MATITYSWESAEAVGFLNDDDTTDDQGSPAIASLTNGGYFAAWDTSPSGAFVTGRVIDDGGTPLASDFVINSTTINSQYDSSIAGLNDGNVVVAFTDTSVDAGGDIRARLFDANGTPIDLDFGVNTQVSDDSESDVAALDDGGFVVTWSRDFGGSDLDIRAAIFNADGSIRNSLVQVDTADLLNTNSSSVAGLANGNFVVTWEQEPVAGGSSEVMYRVYDSIGGAVTAATLIDTTGSINEDIQVAALPDGGFVVAYTDNGWAIDGTEITARVFNANGTTRTSFLRPNAETTGDQDLPSLTVMSNGYFVVGWSNGTNLTYQAYDPDGNTIGDNFVVASSVVEGEIAALSGGLVANVRSSTFADAGGDDSIRSSIHELTRTITGDGTGETLAGDTLRDSIRGKGGDDLLLGKGNNDTLNGGGGNDTLNGGTENDVLNGSAGNDVLNGAAGNDKLIGAAGIDRLNGGDNSDKLYGGLGDDILIGGAGSDKFVFDTALDAATNVDRIDDFAANDWIWLNGQIFNNIGVALDAGEFVIGTGAVDADDRIIYNDATGALFFDVDGLGGAAKVRFATLDAGLALSNADFDMILVV